MISKKPLITTTLAIFISVYLITAILAIVGRKPADSFIYGAVETTALIIGGSGAGFFAILALITFNRKKVTDSLYNGKSNKRFSVDKGELFTGKNYAKEEINPDTDLQEVLRQWLRAKDDSYRKVFLELVGILKAHRQLTFNTSIGIYASNCKLTEAMLELNNGLSPDLLILIGFTHNLGRVEVAEETNYSRIASKSRNILANTDEAWQLPEIRELLFIVSNYINDSKVINRSLSDSELESKSVIPYIELLKQAYKQQGITFTSNSTARMQLSDYEIDDNSSTSKLLNQNELAVIETDSEPVIAPEQIVTPTPKSKTKKVTREPEQQRLNKLEDDRTPQTKPDKVKPDMGIKVDQLKI